MECLYEFNEEKILKAELASKAVWDKSKADGKLVALRKDWG